MLLQEGVQVVPQPGHPVQHPQQLLPVGVGVAVRLQQLPPQVADQEAVGRLHVVGEGQHPEPGAGGPGVGVSSSGRPSLVPPAPTRFLPEPPRGLLNLGQPPWAAGLVPGPGTICGRLAEGVRAEGPTRLPLRVLPPSPLLAPGPPAPRTDAANAALLPPQPTALPESQACCCPRLSGRVPGRLLHRLRGGDGRAHLKLRCKP